MPVLWCFYDPVSGLIYHSRCLLALLQQQGWEDADLSDEVKATRRPMDVLADLIDTRVEAGLLAVDDAPTHLDHDPGMALTIVARNGFECAACGGGDLTDDPLE